MTIVVRRRADKFAIIPNVVAEDVRLTFEARGVLCYLLAKPHNWQVSVNDIRKAGSIGRDKVYRILKELLAAGYLRRTVQRDKSGKVTETEYTVFDDPVTEQKPLPEKPDTAEPEAGEPDTANQDVLIRTHPQQEPKGTSTHLSRERATTPRDELLVVLDGEHAAAVIDHRKRIGKPLTAYAAKLLARKFAKTTDPHAAAEAMIANGWQGFEPDWMERRNHTTAAHAPRRSTLADHARTLLAETSQGDGHVLDHKG